MVLYHGLVCYDGIQVNLQVLRGYLGYLSKLRVVSKFQNFGFFCFSSLLSFSLFMFVIQGLNLQLVGENVTKLA
jgi:hypothetical protein